MNNTGVSVTLGLLVNRYSATVSPRLDIWWLGNSPLQYQTTPGSVVEPASSPNAVAVGAVCFANGALEPYSSQGPTVDGRMKPELVGPDSVTSPVYGPFAGCGASGFAGTSAAAPHIAGAAALLAQQSRVRRGAARDAAAPPCRQRRRPSPRTGPGGIWLYAPLVGGPIANADTSVRIANADGSGESQIIAADSREPGSRPTARRSSTRTWTVLTSTSTSLTSTGRARST